MGKLKSTWSKLPLAGKVVSILIAIAVVGGIAGLGDGQQTPEQDSTPAQEQTVSQETKQESATVSSQQRQEEEEERSAQPQASGTLKAHFIDVGQGDSEFLELPDGKTMLIDAGESDEAGTVAGYIKSLGYGRIDYVVATHPHSDHIGGLPGVMSTFEVGEVWAPKVSHTTDAYESFLDAVASKGLSINTAVAGKNVYSANGCSIDVLSPAEGASYDDLNDWSAVLKASFGSDSFLFTGDAGAEVLSASSPGHVDVLKVGHHGSETSTNASLVASLTPEFAVISCGAGNSYGHPDQSTLTALASAQVMRTDVDGTIVATCDGSSVAWQTNVTAPRAAVQQPEASAQPQAESQAQESATPAPSVQQPQASNTQETTVYVTNSGEKYHAAGCQYLKKSKIPISLSEAKASGCTPCSKCNPPA